MKARASLRSLYVLLGTATIVAASCGSGARPPHVVLFVVDTLRSDRLGCYGYPRPTSPRIDALAADGALFLDATAQSGWTRPSMVSMFTGRYVTSHRTDVRDEEETLAETFARAGYRTIGVVANLGLTRKGGFDDGFDRYELLDADMPRRKTVDSDRLTERAFEELDEAREASPNAPVLLYVHAFFPHAPYFRYASFDAALPVDGVPATGPEGWREDVLAERGLPGPWDDDLRPIDLGRGRYDQEVRFTDRAFGRLLDGLEERGLLSDAIVALVSDHGEGLWDRVGNFAPGKDRGLDADELFYMSHGAHLYEEAVRTPFVLWGAGVPARVESTPVENVDLFPTLLELTGVAGPAGLHGHSLVPLLRGGPAPNRDAVFAHLDHKQVVREIETGLKLTVPGDAPQSPHHEVELFDLGADPLERANLAGEREADRARLGARLEAWRAAHPSGIDGALDESERDVLEGLGYTETELGED